MQVLYICMYIKEEQIKSPLTFHFIVIVGIISCDPHIATSDLAEEPSCNEWMNDENHSKSQPILLAWCSTQKGWWWTISYLFLLCLSSLWPLSFPFHLMRTTPHNKVKKRTHCLVLTESFMIKSWLTFWRLVPDIICTMPYPLSSSFSSLSL